MNSLRTGFTGGSSKACQSLWHIVSFLFSSRVSPRSARTHEPSLRPVQRSPGLPNAPQVGRMSRWIPVDQNEIHRAMTRSRGCGTGEHPSCLLRIHGFRSFPSSDRPWVDVWIRCVFHLPTEGQGTNWSASTAFHQNRLAFHPLSSGLAHCSESE